MLSHTVSWATRSVSSSPGAGLLPSNQESWHYRQHERGRIFRNHCANARWQWCIQWLRHLPGVPNGTAYYYQEFVSYRKIKQIVQDTITGCPVMQLRNYYHQILNWQLFCCKSVFFQNQRYEILVPAAHPMQPSRARTRQNRTEFKE